MYQFSLSCKACNDLEITKFQVILMFFFRNQLVMKWSREHDAVFVKELLLFEPWKYTKGTPERAGIWENIAESLEQVDAPYFRVDKRAVRDRYNKLVKEHKKKRIQEEKASGIAPEHDEVNDALDNIVDLLEQFEKEHQIETDKEKRKTEEEQGKAVEMR